MNESAESQKALTNIEDVPCVTITFNPDDLSSNTKLENGAFVIANDLELSLSKYTVYKQVRDGNEIK